MKQFMIISPHTEGECLAALDEAVATGTQHLAMWHWGCMAGDHTGYAMVDANNEAEVRSLVPALVRDKAKVIPVQSLTSEQIQGFHQQH